MNQDNKKSNNIFKLVWNAIMVFIYLAIAYLILFTPRLLPYSYMPDSQMDDFLIPRIILGGGVAMYALFRGYRVLKDKR